MEPEEALWVRPQLDLDSRVEIPRDRLPAESVDPRTAAQIVRDELLLDGNARLNLATFVTTWMEPEAVDADRRVPGQEPRRQGRVPAERGAGDAAA